MSSLRKLVVVIFMLSIPMTAYADSSSDGQVGTVNVGGGGIVDFTIQGTYSNLPTCNTMNRYVIDTNDASGKAIYAMLLSAKTTHSNIHVGGNASCTLADKKSEGVQDISF